jgi:hypothetical protein
MARPDMWLSTTRIKIVALGLWKLHRQATFPKEVFYERTNFGFVYVHAFDKRRPTSVIVGQDDEACTDLHMLAEYHRVTDGLVKTAIRRETGTR